MWELPRPRPSRAGGLPGPSCLHPSFCDSRHTGDFGEEVVAKASYHGDPFHFPPTGSQAGMPPPCPPGFESRLVQIVLPAHTSEKETGRTWE